MRKALETGLDSLQTGLVKLLEADWTQLTQLMQVIEQSDWEKLEAIIQADEQLDLQSEESIQAVLHLIALQQPVAGDLRQLGAGLFQLRSLERIGDQCVNIAKTLQATREIEQAAPQEMMDTIQRMGAYAQEQIVQARQAFQLSDVTVALQIRQLDIRINFLQRELFDQAKTTPSREWSLHLILVGRALERIGDLTVHIADQLVYALEGVHLPPRDDWDSGYD